MKNRTLICNTIMVVLIIAGVVSAQQLEPIPAGGQKTTAHSEIQKIYNLTEVARKPADFQRIAQRCEKLLASASSEKDKAYLNSLVGWSRNRLAQSHAKTAASMKEMGLVEQADEELQKAIEQFDLVIRNHPTTWRSWMGRAKIHAAQGQYELALEKFVEVTKRKRDQISAWFNCGELSARLNQYEPAIKYYSRVIAEDASDIQARTGRAHCLLALDQVQAAIDEYRTIANLQADDEIALCNLGDALCKAENWSQALKAYQSAAELEKATLGLERLAHLLCTCEDPSIVDSSRAIKLAKQAIENGEPSFDFLSTLATAYRADGQSELAAEISLRAESKKKMPADRQAQLPGAEKK